MSQDLYLDITDFARTTPSWFQTLAELWTEAGLLLFGLLFVVGWWLARSAGSRVMALALLAPLATAFGYVVSEALKSLVDEERPCRAVAGAGRPLVECPPYGDWSFPSNHSAIAGAAAVAVTFALVAFWRWIAWPAVVMAVLMAFSRVFVGVHYPHDVAAGLVLGATFAFVFVRLLTRPALALVETARTSRNTLAVWCVGRGPRAHASVRPGRVPHRSL